MSEVLNKLKALHAREQQNQRATSSPSPSTVETMEILDDVFDSQASTPTKKRNSSPSKRNNSDGQQQSDLPPLIGTLSSGTAASDLSTSEQSKGKKKRKVDASDVPQLNLQRALEQQSSPVAAAPSAAKAESLVLELSVVQLFLDLLTRSPDATQETLVEELQRLVPSTPVATVESYISTSLTYNPELKEWRPIPNSSLAVASVVLRSHRLADEMLDELETETSNLPAGEESKSLGELASNCVSNFMASNANETDPSKFWAASNLPLVTFLLNLANGSRAVADAVRAQIFELLAKAGLSSVFVEGDVCVKLAEGLMGVLLKLNSVDAGKLSLKQRSQVPSWWEDKRVAASAYKPEPVLKEHLSWMGFLHSRVEKIAAIFVKAAKPKADFAKLEKDVSDLESAFEKERKTRKEAREKLVLKMALKAKESEMAALKKAEKEKERAEKERERLEKEKEKERERAEKEKASAAAARSQPSLLSFFGKSTKAAPASPSAPQSASSAPTSPALASPQVAAAPAAALASAPVAEEQVAVKPASPKVAVLEPALAMCPSPLQPGKDSALGWIASSSLVSRVLEEGSSRSIAIKPPRRKFRMLQFTEMNRPEWVTTRRQTSKTVKGRHPFRQEQGVDYLEWSDEGSESEPDDKESLGDEDSSDDDEDATHKPIQDLAELQQLLNDGLVTYGLSESCLSDPAKSAEFAQSLMGVSASAADVQSACKYLSLPGTTLTPEKLAQALKRVKLSHSWLQNDDAIDVIGDDEIMGEMVEGEEGVKRIKLANPITVTKPTVSMKESSYRGIAFPLISLADCKDESGKAPTLSESSMFEDEIPKGNFDFQAFEAAYGLHKYPEPAPEPETPPPPAESDAELLPAVVAVKPKKPTLDRNFKDEHLSVFLTIVHGTTLSRSSLLKTIVDALGGPSKAPFKTALEKKLDELAKKEKRGADASERWWVDDVELLRAHGVEAVQPSKFVVSSFEQRAIVLALRNELGAGVEPTPEQIEDRVQAHAAKKALSSSALEAKRRKALAAAAKFDRSRSVVSPPTVLPSTSD